MVARGSQKSVSCDFCGSRVPHSKAYVMHKPAIGGVQAGAGYFRPMKKYYLCKRCAQRKHIIQEPRR